MSVLHTVVSLLTLAAVLGLYVMVYFCACSCKKKDTEAYATTKKASLFGGPYEGCQQRLCGADKKCMCEKKAAIDLCCAGECKDLPGTAKTLCLDECTPIPGLDPCK